MAGIEVEHISADRLSCETWRFSMDTGYGHNKTIHLRLQFYGKANRPSTRHKFKFEPKNRFDNIDHRRYNSGIAVEDVPLPEDVKAEAISKIELNFIHPKETT